MRVMLVHDRTMDQISPALAAPQYQVVAVLGPDDDLIAHAKQAAPDLVVLDLSAPRAGLMNKLYDLNQMQPLPIVMFTDEADAQAIRNAITAGVSAYIVDGLYVNRLEPVLNVAMARFQEMQALRNELHETRKSLNDRKRIDRAKGILMQRRGINENEAYHSLRKLAMQRNQRIAEVADSVISAAELLG